MSFLNAVQKNSLTAGWSHLFSYSSDGSQIHIWLWVREDVRRYIILFTTFSHRPETPAGPLGKTVNTWCWEHEQIDTINRSSHGISGSANEVFILLNAIRVLSCEQAFTYYHSILFDVYVLFLVNSTSGCQ